MRPSSSSLVIARARISFSVKSLKRLGMGYLYKGRFRKRMAQKPPTSHPRMSHPSGFPLPRLPGQYFRTTITPCEPRYPPVRFLYRFRCAAQYPIPNIGCVLGKVKGNGFLVRADDESERSGPLATVKNRTPRQSPLQNYPADAHSPLGSGAARLRRHSRHIERLAHRGLLSIERTRL